MPGLARKIAGFPRWHYQFDLLGHKTPVYDPDMVNRHEQRRRHVFRPVVDLLGGSLAGKRVLDLGCNAGFWSLCAVESGCDYVLGIDGRPMHVEQANLVFQVKGVSRQRYDFRCANVFDVRGDLGSFDLVLCLGVLYHTCKPMELLEWVARVNSDVLLIDTSLSARLGLVLEFYHEPCDEPRHSCDYELVMFPTRGAVLDMVRQVGYRAVVLRPDFDDYTGADDFRVGRRRAFVCAKQTPLEGLPVEPDEGPPKAGVLARLLRRVGGRGG
jgi:SAM-dependent methyltransferase